jgi:hypothetical protein
MSEHAPLKVVVLELPQKQNIVGREGVAAVGNANGGLGLVAGEHPQDDTSLAELGDRLRHLQCRKLEATVTQCRAGESIDALHWFAVTQAPR